VPNAFDIGKGAIVEKGILDAEEFFKMMVDAYETANEGKRWEFKKVQHFDVSAKLKRQHF
jgi:predicted rRNA methylase YqxC with S4 and FtsJ domains